MIPAHGPQTVFLAVMEMNSLRYLSLRYLSPRYLSLRYLSLRYLSLRYLSRHHVILDFKLRYS